MVVSRVARKMKLVINRMFNVQPLFLAFFVIYIKMLSWLRRCGCGKIKDL